MKYLNMLNRQGTNEVLQWGFISTLIVSTLIIAIIFIIVVVKFRQVFKERALNVYRMLQYTMLILYLFLVTATNFTKLIDGIELHNYLLFIYVSFAYFYAEVINIVSWVNFLMHLKMYSR